MFNLIKSYSTRIKDGRRETGVMFHLLTEVAELRDEVLAKQDNSAPGDDGIFGEAIDVIICALDLIFIDNPNVTQEEIMAYAAKKCDKWESKSLNRS